MNENWQQQKWRRVRFSTSHLPPSFLAARLPTPFTSLNLYAKTRGAKCLPLQVKNKLKTKIDKSIKAP